MTIVNKREQIQKSLTDSEYRHQFIEEEINVGLAFQIRALRNRQHLKQADLAGLLHVKQPLVSSWENPEYGKYSLGTLKELAKAFDVGLLVRFVSFSTLVDWTANLSNNTIAPPNYNEEEQYNVAAAVTRAPIPMNNIKYVDANSLMMDYVNKLVPGTFPTGTANNNKEFQHA